MLSFLRPAAVMLALSAPVQAQSLSAIAEAEHRIWRDRIVGLFTELEGIPDDAPMASAQRLHLLAQVRFWTTAIAEWPPGMAKPSPVREMLAVDPARAVPALAVPLEEQVAREVDRVHEAKDACLDDPTATCLLDAAAGYAAASKSMQGAAVVHLRLARVAQMTNDPARLGLLRRMAVEEVPLYERKQDLDGERVESGLVTRANSSAAPGLRPRRINWPVRSRRSGGSCRATPTPQSRTCCWTNTLGGAARPRQPRSPKRRSISLRPRIRNTKHLAGWCPHFC